ncbi:hypothetical protein DENSPDRAFT_372910 [Dentipellis sp. KUC8613]|nr:hypothetical protein DENSPDRAFT_372910 [Dentipellis sp. KUC8613]
MNLIVTKVYPIAFLEFFEENGKKRREGPRKEKEELLLQDQWMKRREKEQARLRSELEDKINIYEDWADRLERRSGSHFHPTEDDPQPNHIEDIFDELDGGKEFSVVTARISLTEAGWLARFIRDKIAQERAQIGEEIERDLKHVCPPRDVRSFRVLFMKDACSIRKPSQRTAEITVWDVMSLSFDEGKQAGNFAEGQRFLRMDETWRRLAHIPLYEKGLEMDPHQDSLRSQTNLYVAVIPFSCSVDSVVIIRLATECIR